uniref:Armadillo like helical domain containing 1 n=1 Tax=Phasianus colchicus TaxID=9054 RepID=A0A669P8V4_PHACC
MTSVKEQEAIRKLMIFLQEWDSAHRVARSHILDNFIRSNNGKTEPELELEFSQGASLFLARLAAWLRMTYLCAPKQVTFLALFLHLCRRRYIIEFLEIGGVLTLLEILGLNHLKEEDKRESVKLLQLIADAGRKYKELICESYGVRSLAELLATCSSAEAQEEAQILLGSLGRGNPKYQNQVYNGLLAVLPRGSPHAQQLALQTLHSMQVTKHVPKVTAVVGRPQRPALCGLCLWQRTASPPFSRLINVSKHRSYFPRIPPADPTLRPTEPMPAHVQQAAAAKAVGILAKESAEVAEELIQLKVVHGLMVAMGNLDYPLSQRNASISLEVSVMSLSRTLEQKCSMHCFSLFLSTADRVHKGRSATTKRVLGSQCSPSHTCSTPQLALGAGIDRIKWLTKVVSLDLDSSTEL